MEAYGDPLVLILSLMAAGAVVLWAVTPNKPCRYCDHCKELARLAMEKKIEDHHRTFHAWENGRFYDVKTCDDPECRGRKL
jgi:hypothetical protein